MSIFYGPDSFVVDEDNAYIAPQVQKNPVINSTLLSVLNSGRYYLYLVREADNSTSLKVYNRDAQIASISGGVSSVDLYNDISENVLYIYATQPKNATHNDTAALYTIAIDT